MKLTRSLYAAVVTTLIVASFLAGLWFNNRRTVSKQHQLAEKPAAVDTGKGITVDTGSDDDTDASSLPSGTVTISPEKQQLIGVRTGVVEKSIVTKELRLLGRVAPDETRIFKMKTSVDGIIREVYPSTTGSLVKEGQPLASFYSPDIYAAEQDYLIAKSSDRYGGNLQVRINEDKLRFLGMSTPQIEELKNTGKLTENVVLSSPVTGFVLAREVSPDLRFQKGEELYRIAALDRVWIYADIYEGEGRYVRPHDTAKISHPQLDKKLDARVSGVLPLFDAGTRTLKVRLEVVNPGFILRPNMFVDIELPVSIPATITVPADAIVNSGLKKIVFIERGNGIFEPRKVETGLSFGDKVQILKGLKPGEKIVISGTFLIDSESKLRGVGPGSPQSATTEEPPSAGGH